MLLANQVHSSLVKGLQIKIPPASEYGMVPFFRAEGAQIWYNFSWKTFKHFQI